MSFLRLKPNFSTKTPRKLKLPCRQKSTPSSGDKVACEAAALFESLRPPQWTSLFLARQMPTESKLRAAGREDEQQSANRRLTPRIILSERFLRDLSR